MTQFIKRYVHPPKIEVSYSHLEYAVKDQKELNTAQYRRISDEAQDQGRAMLAEKYDTQHRDISRNVDQELTRQAKSKKLLTYYREQ